MSLIVSQSAASSIVVSPSGIRGAQGTQGLQGPAGSTASGSASQGVQGIQGITGAGIQGIQGITGIQGTEGSQGIQGTIGSQGIQGIAGTAAENGSQGIQGIQGITGTGTQGTQGIQGIAGTAAENGSQGIQGIQGTTGAGSQGIQGITGLQGIQGTIGNQGIQGIAGSAAENGAQGIQGIQGITGTGTQGTQGIQGISGAAGSAFPYTGNATITGTLVITGSVSGGPVFGVYNTSAGTMYNRFGTVNTGGNFTQFTGGQVLMSLMSRKTHLGNPTFFILGAETTTAAVPEDRDFAITQFKIDNNMHGGIYARKKGNYSEVRIFSKSTSIVDESDISFISGSLIQAKRKIETNNNIEFTNSSNGIILKSPGGTRYRVSVDNSGNLVTTAV